MKVAAYAKVNFTLEVLGVRPDGYHDLRSVVVPISLADEVTLEPADEVTLDLGSLGSLRSLRSLRSLGSLRSLRSLRSVGSSESLRTLNTLDTLKTEDNLAMRAARLMQRVSGRKEGVAITLEKHIPVGGGLGGGSADAAAVLNGLNEMWRLGIPKLELARLGGIVCEGPEFEPTIKARDPRTIPEFVKLYGTSLTQSAALATLRALMEKDDNIVCAGGSLPSDLQRVWKTDKRGGYHVEYGYSCMGYEVGASMGVKMAQPEVEEYTVIGDAGFQMLNSELGTIMQERIKTNILVFDNCGFGCINNLEMTHGIGSLATEFRYTDGKKPAGDLIPMDYAKIGEAYGMKSYTCRSVEELAAAIKDAKTQKVACLFDLKVVPKTMTDGYGSWWNVGIAMTSQSESVQEAAREVLEHREQARQY